jgi:tetratricopeptide (TPR) repeat protein
MHVKRSPLGLALALALAVSSLQAQGQPGASLQRYLQAPQADVAAVDALLRQSTLAGTTPAQLLTQLQGAATGGDTRASARARFAQAWLEWRQGDRQRAVQELSAGPIAADDVGSLRLLAALHDAGGELAEARRAYDQAIAASQGQTRWNLQVRRALVDEDPVSAVQALGHAVPEHAARLGVLLAMLGRSDLALAAPVTGKPPLLAALQRAVWALDGGQPQAARSEAWQAFQLADEVGDQRYALALWMESWREAGALDQAVTFLRSQKPQPELQQALVDALLERGRFDEAITLVRASSTPALRQRLLGILELAGRRDEVAGEYRRQIAAAPHALAGYVGLAAQELADGRPEQALQVFERLFRANPGNASLLLPAARQMASMGLQEQALALLQAAGNGAELRTAVALFEFDGRAARGDDAGARQVLDRLHAVLPAGSPSQAEVADGYERLQQPHAALDVLVAMERARTQPLDYDLRVRIANLAGAAGEPRQALERWQALWKEARLPARRAFLERQIVKVARELNALEPMAAALEQQQARRQLSAEGVDLLVALSLAMNAPQRAQAAVARHAQATGASQVTALMQMGGLYARLGDNERVDDVLRQLVQRDPANAGIYLRKLAVNNARHPRTGPDGEPLDDRVRLAELQDLLRQLQRSEPGNETSGQYAAGLYAMAGLDDAAVGAYERAVALSPDDLDSLLQLAELRKRQQRVGEAVAMLQAATLADESQRRFVQLADGLSGVVAIAPDERVRRGDARANLGPLVNGWLQRQLLGRLAIDADDYPLQAVLADLGQTIADFPLQRRAYDNSLAGAGEQRALILRQLVTLVSGGNGLDGAAGPSIGDNARKVRYGRRLLALQREFPPDFYADLGRSLLASGDALGAERAFAAMSDIGGLVNVAQVKGDIYAQQGMAEQALINYGQALARDQDNLELLQKTAIVLEQRGQDAQANHWYWHGLRSLVLRQPLLDNGLVNDVALDTARYRPALLEGLLLTWDEASPVSQNAWRDLQALFRQTLEQSAGASQPWSKQPRLADLLAMVQRVGMFRGDGAAVNAAEEAVLTRFGDDKAALAAVQVPRLRSGRAPAVAAPGTGDWVRNGLAEQAAVTSNAALALALAAASGDEQRIHTLMADAVAAEARWQALDARQAQTDPGPDTVYVLLEQGMAYLTREQFLQWVYAPIDASPIREAVLFNLYRGAAEQYATLEKTVGRRLLPDDVLMRLLVEQGNRPLPFLVSKRMGMAELGDALVGRFDTEGRLSLLERFSADSAAGKGHSMLQPMLAQDLLRRPLSAAQRERLARALASMIDHPMDFEQGSAAFAVSPLLVLDLDRGNQAVLLQAAERIARLYPDGAHFPSLLKAWFDGDRVTALAELQALHEAMGEMAGNTVAQVIGRYFPEQRQARIDAFLAAPTADSATATAFYREFVADAGFGEQATPPAVRQRYLEKLVAVDPDNETYAASLLDLLEQKGDTAAFRDRLAAYVEAHPQQTTAAVTLQFELRMAGQDQKEAAVSAQSGVSLDDVPAVLALVNKARAPTRQAYSPDFNRLLTGAYERFQSEQPQAPLSKAVAAQMRAASEGRVNGASLQALAKARREAPDTVPGVLRATWRSAPPGPRQALLSQPFDSDGNVKDSPASTVTDGIDLLRTLAAEPAVARELDLYLRAMTDNERPRNQALYDLLAAGLMEGGQAPARIQALRTALGAGEIDAHHAQLLATLLVQSRQGLQPSELQALTALLQRMPLMAPLQRGRLAAVYALSADSSTAELLMQAATLQLLHRTAHGTEENDVWLQPQQGLETLALWLGDWPDRAAARRCWAWMQARIEAEGSRPEVGIKDFKRPAWLERP